MSLTSVAVRPTEYTELNAILSGYKLAQADQATLELSYSLPFTLSDSASFTGIAYESFKVSQLLEYPIFGLSKEQVQLFQEALTSWESVANLSFIEILETERSVGEIRVTFASQTGFDAVDKGGSTAFVADLKAINYSSFGDIWVNESINSEASSSELFKFVMVHELGHILGLEHSFEGALQLPSNLDTTNQTVMSYTLAPYIWFEDRQQQLIYPSSPSLLDVAAIQYLYGPNLTTASGDTRYTFDSNTPFYKTVWDADGFDTLDASEFTLPCDIDLRPGSFSSLRFDSPTFSTVNQDSQQYDALYRGIDNLAIAYDCDIEAAYGGRNSDKLTGNTLNNLFYGNFGDDSIDGGLGLDTARFDVLRTDARLEAIDGNMWRLTSPEGTDTLTSVERLMFDDRGIALDLDGAAGKVAKLLGAVFGEEATSNLFYVAAGLDYIDSLGTSELAYEALAELALVAANLSSHEAIVDVLYKNLTHAHPTAAEASPFIEWLDAQTLSPAQLAIYAAEHPLNIDNIDLAGLSATGLEYQII